MRCACASVGARRLSLGNNTCENIDLCPLPVACLNFLRKDNSTMLGQIEVQHDGTPFLAILFFMFACCVRTPNRAIDDPFRGLLSSWFIKADIVSVFLITTPDSQVAISTDCYMFSM